MRRPHAMVTAIAAVLMSMCFNAVLAETPDEQMIERGKYLVVITGCNDCHTDGYLLSQGEIAEEQWLTGNPVG